MFYEKQKLQRNVTLTITESCNLNCTYCYENHKSKKCMSFETAKNIIDKELENADEYSEIVFDIFGGEPFIEFELLCEIYDYIVDSNVNNVRLFVTTNGSLIHGDIKKWLYERKEKIICGLSYDGTFDMQDINRSNSSSKIDLDFFLKTYPEQAVKMTVSKETLSTLFDGVIFLQEKGFDVECNLAYNIDWSDGNNKGILQNELMKLIDYYLQRPEVTPCSIIDAPIENVSLAKGEKLIGVCGAGTGTVAYHIDGTAYPCQFFMPLSVGEEQAKK